MSYANLFDEYMIIQMVAPTSVRLEALVSIIGLTHLGGFLICEVLSLIEQAYLVLCISSFRSHTMIQSKAMLYVAQNLCQ